MMLGHASQETTWKFYFKWSQLSGTALLRCVWTLDEHCGV